MNPWGPEVWKKLTEEQLFLDEEAERYEQQLFEEELEEKKRGVGGKDTVPAPSNKSSVVHFSKKVLDEVKNEEK